MSKTIDVKCDECGKDLNYTGYANEYYIHIQNNEIRPWYLKEGMSGGAVLSMSRPPPLEQPMDFCDIDCLRNWVIDKNLRSRA